MKRIHLGCGNKILEGFINCDIRPGPGVSRVFDLEKCPWPFEAATIDFIETCETLEHLSWRVQERVFVEMHRILVPGGRINLQVPDIGKMCHNYVNGEICDCVPHKANTKEEFLASAGCEKCSGKGIVNPTRWLMAFCGAQKHPWDTHRTMFTREYLEELAAKSNLRVVKYDEHPYKLKALLEKDK